MTSPQNRSILNISFTQQTKNAIKWTFIAIDKKKLELESKLSTVRANFEQALLENQNATQTLTSLTSEFEEYDKLLFKNKSKRDSTQLQVYTNNKEIALVDENLSLCSKQTRDWEVSH